MAGMLIWEQPNRTPHGLWLFGMSGVDQAGNASEDIYFGCQDTGTFANTNVGAAAPSADWHNRDCCDTFDLGADDDTVLFTNGAFSSGRQFRLFFGDPRIAGLQFDGDQHLSGRGSRHLFQVR
jgi:hypothetical protein